MFAQGESALQPRPGGIGELMAEILYGAPAAESIKAETGCRALELSNSGVVPCLGILRMGRRDSQLSYERGLRKTCESLGIRVESIVLPETGSEKQLREAIAAVNENDEIHGCVILRPLPGNLERQELLDLLRPEKDVDGVTGASLARMMTGQGPGYAPCTAEAVLRLLDHYGVPLAGAQVTVIGRSLVVGKPLALLLTGRDATVTLCHSKTRQLPELCRRAEILISAAGQTGLVNENYVNQNQSVVDVGVNLNEEGKLCGDVVFGAVEPRVRAISPVPRGLGAVTTAILAEHVVLAALAAAGRDAKQAPGQNRKEEA